MEVSRYPRTPHLEGSGLESPGGERVPFSELRGLRLVVEEKLDDSHLALSFEQGRLRLHHRSSPVGREPEFAPVKAWASGILPELAQALGERYVLHGGSLYAKHTVFYDALPAWFVEYDVFDREQGEWLSTERRRQLLAALPVHSAPVLHEGQLDSLAELVALVGPSRYKSPGWRRALAEAAQGSAAAIAETDQSDSGEGLYVKVEEGGRVSARYKWVRRGFLEALEGSGSHWRSRPLLANRLAS